MLEIMFNYMCRIMYNRPLSQCMQWPTIAICSNGFDSIYHSVALTDSPGDVVVGTQPHLELKNISH